MSLWRKDPPEVTPQEGRAPLVVKGGMWPYQREWWELPNFFKALVTGYGGGKTLVGAKRAISTALQNGQPLWREDICPTLAVFPSYKIARRTAIPTLRALLAGKESLLPGFSWEYSSGASEFTITYRGRRGTIWIASGDDPVSLKGPNVGAAWVDEPFVQDEEVLNVVLSRVRAPNATVSEVILTGTPEELNWGYDICEGDRKEQFDIGLIQASTDRNLALDPAYAKRMRSAYADAAVAAYVEGKFVNLQSGRVYYAFDKSINVVDLPDPGGELFVGNDFNVNPMAGIVFWLDGDHMHVMDEIELENADTEYFCSYILDNFSVDIGGGDRGCRVSTFFPDASGSARNTASSGGRSDFTIISDFGFRIDAPRANPMVRDRENAVNGKFKPFDGRPSLTISPRCKRLIGYLNKYTHENRNREGRAMSHLLDSLGYPVHRMFPIERVRFYTTKLSGL